MHKLIICIAALVIVATPLSANAELSKDEIAKFPQDRVEAIRQLCARQWGHDYDMRVFCEDKQYRALKALIERGPIEK